MTTIETPTSEPERGDGASVPRVVEFITVKRNVPMTGRSYGHWWLELDADESYGWWPGRHPLSLRHVLGGVPGTLNGLDLDPDAKATRDPSHGLPGDHEFHPVLIAPGTDQELRSRIRRFAQTFVGEWRWSIKPTMNCRLFQLAMFDAVGLVDGTGNYRTRGSGCPVLAPIRRSTARLSGRRRWPRNLPPPGQPVPGLLSGEAPFPSRKGDR